MKFKTLLFIALSLGLAQCSKQSEKIVTQTNEVKVPVEASYVEAYVSADAGASLSIGSKIQLTVPAGALNADTNISVTKAAVAAPVENLVPLSNSLELGAHGVEFNKPVTLNVCYDAATVAAQQLKEETIQVYYVDPVTGEYAAVGGNVNKSSHCVSTQLAHFSTYLVAAQILQGGNNAPVISAPTFTPTVPMAGLPLKISSVVTDYELNTVNGQIGFGQVATATLYYRIPGEPGFTQVALTPDTLDDTATRYSYKIPANRVTTAGIEYYLKATDNLGLNRIRNTVTLPVARTATGIAFQTTVVVDLAAGFKRSYTLRGIDDLGAQRNIEVDTFAVNNGIGTAAKTSASVVQFTATTANPQNYRIGSLSATAGPFSTTSPDIRVHAGYLDHIALLSPTGVVLGNSITVNANTTYDFDVLGYDAYGNTTNVLPQFVIVPVSGAGTISPTGLYTAPATTQTATLVATLDGVQDSILINVVVPPPPSWYTYIGGQGVDSIGATLLTLDGGFLNIGTSRSNRVIPLQGLSPLNPYSDPFQAASDCLISKLDTNGNVQWFTYLGSSSGEDECFEGVQAQDGGYVLLARSNQAIASIEGVAPLFPYSVGFPNHSEFLVIKLNSAGHVSWFTFLGEGVSAGSNSKIIQNANLSYTIGAGTFNPPPSVHGLTPLNAAAGAGELMLLNLSPVGVLQWYTYLGGLGDESFGSLKKDSAGQALVLGHTNQNISGISGILPSRPYVGGVDILVCKLNPITGQLISYGFYGTGNNESGADILPTADGGFALVTYSTNPVLSFDGLVPVRPYSGVYDAWIIRTDASGAPLWHTFIGSAGQSFQPLRGAIAADSGLFIGGLGSGPITGLTPRRAYNVMGGSTSYPQLYLAKLDSAGSLVWYTFQGSDIYPESMNAVVATPDGGAVISGNAYSGAFPSASLPAPVVPHYSDSDGYILRLQSDGNY